MIFIECNEVSLGYQGIPVSAPVSFQVKKGDYLCIVGENGSGKTTLMRTLLGLLPPLSGQIQWGDGLSGGSFGYLPQQPELDRAFPATVEEVVLSGIQGRGLSSLWIGKTKREHAIRCSDELGVTNLWKKSFATLSGGQQRRVLLARALCSADGILLLDEPTAGLDPAATEDLYAVVKKLNQTKGFTVLMITHDLAAARQYATSILHMGETPSFHADASEYFTAREQGGAINE